MAAPQRYIVTLHHDPIIKKALHIRCGAFLPDKNGDVRYCLIGRLSDRVRITDSLERSYNVRYL